MRKVRVAVAGCGNVSRWSYLPHLVRASHVELAAVADVNPAAAERAAREFRVPRWYADPARMLAETPFELFVNLTSMPNHGPLSLSALRAGRHVWCEKPMATTLPVAKAILREARKRRRIFLAAPFTTTSPAYLELARLVRSGSLGKVCQIRCRYGHGARRMWTGWFFKKGGGSLFDLGVYNVTTITGLMGPAQSVTALSGIAVPVRTLADGTKVRAEAEDNTILLLDFGQARYGVIQSGFTIEKVDGGAGHGADANSASIEVIGLEGTARLLGYDWEPRGLEVGLRREKGWRVVARDQKDYAWQGGATYLARCLATGRRPAVSGAHAYHVLEVMLGAFRSAKAARRIAVRSSF